MKITLEEALAIFEKYGIDVPITFARDIHLFNKRLNKEIRIFQGMMFSSEYYENLRELGVEEIEVTFTELLFAKLVSLFPQKYRLPFGVKSFIEFDKYLNDIEDANRLTKRKRYLISATEIVSKGHTLLRYGESIDIKRWNEIKVYIDRKTQIPYYPSERGILLVTLSNASDPDYLQKFFLHSEAVALFVEKANRLNFALSNDFYPDTDVFTATKEDEAFYKYSENNIRLVVIVDKDIDQRYKSLLAKLKTYDRYCRISAIKNISPGTEEEILRSVKKSYLSDLFIEAR